MLDKHRYKLAAFCLGLAYWIFDSSVHFLGFEEAHFELIPGDINELWMRTGIVLMAFLLGAYADHHTWEILQKEAEKRKVFEATLSASHHILNNFLNQMQLFTLEAEQSRDFDKNLLPLYEQIIDETSAQIRQLESLQVLNELTIKQTTRDYSAARAQTVDNKP